MPAQRTALLKDDLSLGDLGDYIRSTLRTDQETMSAPILQDLLRPGLLAVFCGTAAGTQSAERGEYYAGRGNRFWRILHEIGLTPGERPLLPSDWRKLDEFDLGLTDLAKIHFGSDASLPKGCFDVPRLREALDVSSPRALAFNGVLSGQTFLGRKVSYGLQDETIGQTAVWVLPSTSGAANGTWNGHYWHKLADSLSAAPSLRK